MKSSEKSNTISYMKHMCIPYFSELSKLEILVVESPSKEALYHDNTILESEHLYHDFVFDLLD